MPRQLFHAIATRLFLPFSLSMCSTGKVPLSLVGVHVCVCMCCSDQHGFSPLHYACVHGHSGIVEHFLLRGARTDILNMGGDSLIHVAAQFGKYDVVMKVRPAGYILLGGGIIFKCVLCTFRF